MAAARRVGRAVALLTCLLAAIGADPPTLRAQSGQGVITGVVTDSAGVPLPQSIIRLYRDTTRRVAHTNAAGRFSLAGVPAGANVLVGIRIGYVSVTDTVAVRAGETLAVRLALRHYPFRPDTLPSRVPRGTRVDTVPRSADLLAAVTRTARLAKIRPASAHTQQRELRLWVGFGMAIPMRLFRLTVDGERVRGELINWVDVEMARPDDPPSWRSLVGDLPGWLRTEQRCGAVTLDTIPIGERRTFARPRIVATCRVPLRVEPDWSSVLRTLEGHQVWSLPDESELPQTSVVVTDGVGIVVEAWNGSRYRLYSFGNPDVQPSPEAKHAAAIIALVNRLQ